MLYLGIDLGTTYSLIAYVNDHGLPTLFPDYHDASEFRTPSTVHISNEGCLVGTALEELLDDEPDLSQARFFKLNMGQSHLAYCDHLNRQWSSEALSALVIKKLLQDVEAFAQEEIAGVLIAVPANFNNAQRKATKQAAMMAGLARVKLIEEPVAAATFYGKDNFQTEQTLFVYDLGGGTFDATVLQVGEQGLFALATEGSNELGGKHVDDIIVNYILEEFHRQHQLKLDDEITLMTLRRFAQEAKLKLSKPGKSKVSKTLVLAGKTMDFILSKDHFNQLIDEFVEETLAVCQQALDASGLDWHFIDTVLLTGGSSLLPLVVDKLSKASGKPRDSLVCKQPHQAVAYGTAILANQLFSGRSDKKLQSICSYDLGIRVAGEGGKPTVKVLVSQNTSVPAAATTTFYTTREDQDRLIIEAVQKRHDTSRKTSSGTENSLGYFAFAIENPRKNYPIEIELAYDLEGIVTVTARDPQSGQQIKQVMDDDCEALDRTLLEQQSWIQKTKING